MGMALGQEVMARGAVRVEPMQRQGGEAAAAIVGRRPDAQPEAGQHRLALARDEPDRRTALGGDATQGAHEVEPPLRGHVGEHPGVGHHQRHAGRRLGRQGGQVIGQVTRHQPRWVGGGQRNRAVQDRHPVQVLRPDQGAQPGHRVRAANVERVDVQPGSPADGRHGGRDGRPQHALHRAGDLHRRVAVAAWLGADGEAIAVGQQVQAGAGAHFEQGDRGAGLAGDQSERRDQQHRAARLVGLGGVRRNQVRDRGAVVGDEAGEGRVQAVIDGARIGSRQAGVVGGQRVGQAGEQQVVDGGQEDEWGAKAGLRVQRQAAGRLVIGQASADRGVDRRPVGGELEARVVAVLLRQAFPVRRIVLGDRHQYLGLPPFRVRW